MTTINEQLNEILNQTPQASTGFGADFHRSLELVGEQYGIYEAMTQTGPVTPQELAGCTGLPETHVRLWLEAQASGGWLYHCPAANRFCLWCRWTPRQSQ